MPASEVLFLGAQLRSNKTVGIILFSYYTHGLPRLGRTTEGGRQGAFSAPRATGGPGLRSNYKSTVSKAEAVVLGTNRFYVTYILL